MIGAALGLIGGKALGKVGGKLAEGVGNFFSGRGKRKRKKQKEASKKAATGKVMTKMSATASPGDIERTAPSKGVFAWISENKLLSGGILLGVILLLWVLFGGKRKRKRR